MKIKNNIIKGSLFFLFLGFFYVAHTQTAHAASQLQYQLLESFPGFFNAKDVVTGGLPEMILAIYKFGIWTVGIAGMFMMVVGGFMYMGSAGNNSTASSAKGIITDALIGIIGALSAYLILYVINPDLTTMNIGFVAIDVRETIDSAEDAQVSGTVTDSSGLSSRDGYQLDSSFVTALNELTAAGTKTIVTSGLRSLEKQKQLIAKNCKGTSCSPPTCLLKNGPSSCPHTTGRAADIWALNASGSQAVIQKQCLANVDACRNNQYQKKLIDFMHSKGFCVLNSEPWHFEKPKMSSTCN